MSVNPKEYRDQLYRLRAHPSHGAVAPEFVDQRDSFITVYLSLIPFALFEYLNDSSTSRIPSGLIFPTSYLLFWAVYYSYYRPGYLEHRLTAPKKWDVMAVPTILIGVTIWFVKVTVVELGHFILSAVFDSRPKAQPVRARRPARTPAASRQMLEERTTVFQARARETRAEARVETTRVFRAAAAAGGGTTRFYSEPVEESTRSFPHPIQTRPTRIPQEIANALTILGLTQKSDWETIHRRYRQLAKQFHPDLHPEVTGAGKRFMMYDAAYRKLAAVRQVYFTEKREPE